MLQIQIQRLGMAHLAEFFLEFVVLERIKVVQFAGDCAFVPDFVLVLGHGNLHVFSHGGGEVGVLDAGAFLLGFAQNAGEHQHETRGRNRVVAVEADIDHAAFRQVGAGLRRRHDLHADLVDGNEIGELLAVRAVVEDVERGCDHHIVGGQRRARLQQIVQLV